MKTNFVLSRGQIHKELGLKHGYLWHSKNYSDSNDEIYLDNICNVSLTMKNKKVFPTLFELESKENILKKNWTKKILAIIPQLLEA